MSESTEVYPEVTWEVWREHAKGGPDVRVAAQMTARRSRELLRECIKDTADLADHISFYRVRAVTKRERWTER